MWDEYLQKKKEKKKKKIEERKKKKQKKKDEDNDEDVDAEVSSLEYMILGGYKTLKHESGNLV